MTTGGFVDAKGLPSGPLDAAAHFHLRIVPSIRSALEQGQADNVVVCFDCAHHSHDGWRLAAIQELAREAAPARINGIVAHPDNLQGTAATMQFCHVSPGITGQIFTVDGNSPQND